jgi:uracil-DNA glycosylase family 4
MNENEIVFGSLCKEVHDCNLCIRMKDSLRVLNHSVGSLNARVMFIGEAPGRLGADDSGIPFHGDKSGHNFEELLEFANLSREDLYITNAVLCNPRDEKGNNSTPNNLETKNCSRFLIKQINLLNPSIVVTLGATALSAVSLIEKHNLILKTSVRTANKWFDRLLIPLYHPGQRAMMSRSMANQRSDYQFVADSLKNKFKPKKKVYGKAPLKVALIIDYLFHKKSSFTYFALHKIFYLIEYRSIQKWGYRLTDAYIIRQKDGPYCTDLNLFKLKKAIPYLASKNLSKTNIQIYRNENTLFENRLIDEYIIETDVKDLIDEIVKKYGQSSNASLKKAIYFTQPMRNILHLESTNHTNLYNYPIEFSLTPNY